MKKNKNKKQNILSILSGALIGVVNGFFGGGGGMLCVPLVERILKVENKKAHSTTLLIMLPLSISSVFMYAFNITIDWFMISFVSIGFIGGGILGALLLSKLSNKTIRIIFALIVLASGIRMVI